jgi:hypothetical protein
MKAFLRDQGGVGTQLRERTYSALALVPSSPWLSTQALSAPLVQVKKNAATLGLSVTMSMPKPQVARWYLLQSRTAGVWGSRLVAPRAGAEEISLNGDGLLPDRLVVTALDRAGVASPAVRLMVAP